jgi:hypothetical protein
MGGRWKMQSRVTCAENAEFDRILMRIGAIGNCLLCNGGVDDLDLIIGEII